ncbi:transposase [Calothrix rhizosoleniae]|uniref:transposase n=1 Tax=Calothrix rhizosoleniae TaxID=888997 RepID=UPI000B49BB0F|nr:transposase [Calothrix rhizosoleniae]
MLPFQSGGRIAQLIQQAGCQLIYRPPYFPDLNRIEKCWATLKGRVRKLLPTLNNLHDAMEIVLRQPAS